MPMVSDTVVAIIPEDCLSDVLTHVHRAGLGNNARILRPQRWPLREQLRRAGIPVEQAPDRIMAAPCLLMIMAAARSAMGAELVLQHGASASWIVARTGVWNLVDDRVVEETVTEVPASSRVLPPALLTGETNPDAQGPI